MSTFDATSLINQFNANIAAITNASMGAFARSAYRFTLDKEPDAGPDGRYFIDLSDVAPYDRKWGTGENVGVATVSVRVAYNRLGGDFNGGDRLSVNRNAASDSMLIADVCENPDNYNSSNSGISMVVFDGFTRAMDVGKTEIWETRFKVTFRTDLHTSPVQDLMVASLIATDTTALSALGALSLAAGTVAIITATATAGPRVFILDRTNAAQDVANGTSLLTVTGVTGGLWREFVGSGAGNFGSDTTIEQEDSNGDDFQTFRFENTVTDATAGSVDANAVMTLPVNGVQTAAQTITGSGTLFPAGAIGAPGVAVGASTVGLSYDGGNGVIRVSIGGRAAYIYPHVYALDPGSTTNGGFWLDASVTNALEFLTTMTGGSGVIVKGGGVRRIFANAVGISFNDVTTPVAKPTVSGSRGGNAALQSLLSALSSMGLITDSTT